MDETTNEEVRSILKEVFQNNTQVLMISLTDETGLPIMTYIRNDDNSISEIEDTDITNRYAALAGASTSLGDRTLSTLSQERVRLIHVQGKTRDVAIAVSQTLICMVVTIPSGSPNMVAEKLNAQLKAKL